MSNPTLASRIESDLIAAMKSKEAEKLSVLRMLKSAVKYSSIEKGGADYAPTDADVVSVIRKEMKKRQDSIESYEAAKRTDLADKEKAEVTILQTYLPASLSAEQIEVIVKDAIKEVGATSKAQMGAVMKAAQAKAAGQVDGKTLSQLVQKLLN
jgi:uncharacterized protein YqeY